MNSFNLEHFARHLIIESLFYDAEYGAQGNLSLVNHEQQQELFVAAYLPEDGTFTIEKATAWEEDYDPEEDEIGYALAVDSTEYGCYDSPEATADVLLLLAREHNLTPSITLLFEEEV